MRNGLDESQELEAQFYRLCHTSDNATEVIERMKTLHFKGGRLHWNVRPNIDTPAPSEPQKAALLEAVSVVLASETAVSLDDIGAMWRQATQK